MQKSLKNPRRNTGTVSSVATEENEFVSIASRGGNFSSKEDIFRYLSTHAMDMQNAKASFFPADLVFLSYAVSAKVHGISFGPVFTYLKNGGTNFFQIVAYEHIIEVARSLYSEYLSHEDSFDQKREMYRSLSEQMDILWGEYRANKIPDAELPVWYRKFVEVSREWWSYAVLLEDKGRIIDEVIVPLFEKNHSLETNAAYEIVSLLSHPEDPAVFSLERQDFYELCVLVLFDPALEQAVKDGAVSVLKQHAEFVRAVDAYREKYFFKDTDFSDRKVVTLESILPEVKEICGKTNLRGIRQELEDMRLAMEQIQKRKEELRSQMTLSPEEERAIRFATKMVTWNDMRKMGMMKQFYYLFSLLHEIAQRKRVGYAEVAILSVSELEEFLLTGMLPDADELQEREKNLMAVYESDGRESIYYGDDAKEMFRLAQGISSIGDAQELKGSVASRSGGEGITGTVRIIVDPTKDEFNTGEILVTSMTRIEFVPLMKKAKVIITDEGGITCHAAIVSRELGIPCIIGTKIATQVLHDGDFVEVDAEKGIVTILERAGE